MNIEPGSVEHLSQLISQVVAPAFLLSAVGSFTSLLHDRLLAVVARVRSAKEGVDLESSGEKRELVIQRLQRRAKLLNIAMFFAILSGLCGIILIITAFGAALMSLQHVWMAAVLFIAAAFFMLCSLIVFCVDVQMALSGHDLH